MSEINSSKEPFFYASKKMLLREDSTLGEQERLLQWQIHMCLVAGKIAETKKEAWALLAEAREHAVRLNLYTIGFAELYDAVAIFLTWHFSENEYRSYPRFVDDLPLLLPGARLIPPPLKHRQRPDFFIERDGLVSCVEIKTATFTNSHVKQLQRYMDIYMLQTGYAVARKLSGTLTSGMMFLQWPS